MKSQKLFKYASTATAYIPMLWYSCVCDKRNWCCNFEVNRSLIKVTKPHKLRCRMCRN